MILKTIAFFLVMYFLIKLISRLFIPASTRNSARIIFRTFQNMQKQQRSRQDQNGSGGGSRMSDNSELDEIEEAEYEDVTDEPVGETDRKA